MFVKVVVSFENSIAEAIQAKNKDHNNVQARCCSVLVVDLNIVPHWNFLFVCC